MFPQCIILIWDHRSNRCRQVGSRSYQITSSALNRASRANNKNEKSFKTRHLREKNKKKWQSSMKLSINSSFIRFQVTKFFFSFNKYFSWVEFSVGAQNESGKVCLLGWQLCRRYPIKTESEQYQSYLMFLICYFFLLLKIGPMSLLASNGEVLIINTSGESNFQ